MSPAQPSLAPQEWRTVLDFGDNVLRAGENSTMGQCPTRLYPTSRTWQQRHGELPPLLLKGCLNCGGDLVAEHGDYGYGDYSCAQCSRPYEVTSIRTTPKGHRRFVLGRPGAAGQEEQTIPEKKNGRRKFRCRAVVASR